MDSTVISYIETLHLQLERRIEQFLQAHAEVHQEFVRTHEREHQLSQQAEQDALHLAEVRLLETRSHYDILLGERDRRLNERFTAQEKAIETGRVAIEKAVNAAFAAHQEQQAAAFAAQKEATERAAQTVLEQTRANRSALEELQRRMSDVIPRAETEQRFAAMAAQNVAQVARYETDMRDLRDRVKTVESMKAGRVEERSQHREGYGAVVAAIGALVGVALLVMAILSFAAKSS